MKEEADKNIFQSLKNVFLENEDSAVELITELNKINSTLKKEKKIDKGLIQFLKNVLLKNEELVLESMTEIKEMNSTIKKEKKIDKDVVRFLTNGLLKNEELITKLNKLKKEKKIDKDVIQFTKNVLLKYKEPVVKLITALYKINPNLLIEKEENYKGIFQLLKYATFKNGESLVKLITEIDKVDTLNEKTDSLDPADYSFLNLIIMLSNCLIDDIKLTSINEILSMFYSLNYSYIREDESNDILNLFMPYLEKEKKDNASFSDIKDLINLFESYGDQVISKWFPENKNKKIIYQKFPAFSENLERFMKIYAATYALKEIAYARSIMKDQIEVELVSSIVKIILYSNPLFSKQGANIFTDPHIKNFIVSLKGHENINVRWEPSDKLKEEAREIANNLWSKGDTRYHDEVAKDIYNIQLNSHPEIRGATEFTEADFNAPYSVRKLCEAINKDKYNLQLKKQDNTVDRLNEILRITDLAQQLDEKYDNEELPPNVEQLFNKTEKVRETGKSFVKLRDEERKNILRLNRALLKIIYPNETPRQPEKDFSRYYSIKVVREAIADIAAKYGRKSGIHTNK